MNVAMFLSPKSEIVYLYDDMTVRQAMEKMEYHRYQCLPVITREGRYAGVVTEGDLLWAFHRSPNFTFQSAEHMMLSDIPRHFRYEAIRVNQEMDSLISTAYRQSFVPVVDDTQTFIGLVKRSDIIHYVYERSKNLQAENDQLREELSARKASHQDKSKVRVQSNLAASSGQAALA